MKNELLLKILREDYIQAENKKEKSSILDTYCLNSGRARKYVIRTIRSGVDPATKERRKRKPVYDEEVTSSLVKIWEILDYPCGQKLKTILEVEVGRLVRSGKLTISDDVAEKLKQVSSATIDRKLKQQRGVSYLQAMSRKAGQTEEK
jgi:hypothetical protein